MVVQPQVALLLKTILQIEGLGRQLDPELDLRAVAQPILARFMSEQGGIRGALRHLKEEAPMWAATLPQLPRLMHRILTDDTQRRLEAAVDRIAAAQIRQTRVLFVIAIVLAGLVAAYLLR